MRTLLKLLLFTLIAFFLSAARPGAAGAGPITDDLKASIDRVLSILQDPSLGAPERSLEREKLISSAIGDKFDWEEMARRALGRHWRSLTPAQQKEFVEIFNQFLEKTYVAKVDLFLKEEKNFSAKSIAYGAETIDGQYAMVESKISFREEDVPLAYKLINKKGAWVVYDLTLEGVGIVANYRTQFNEILANGTYEKLLEKLKSKQLAPLPEKDPAAAAKKNT